MDAYMKSFSAYRILKKLTVLSHSLILDSLENETSSITVKGSDIGQEDAGNWLVIDGNVYRISLVKPQEGRTTLTLTSPLNAFTRPLELSQQAAGSTIGAFVASAMQDNWIENSDPVYAIGYLSVSDADTNAYIAPEVDSSGCFVLADYCRLMRTGYRTALRFWDGGSKLLCSIFTAVPGERQVSFEDGRSQLQRTDYSASGIAKLTVLCDVDTGEKDEDGNRIYLRERSLWYLSETGEISQDIPDRRAAGQWSTVYVKGRENIEAKVAETFAKNSSNHKLEFYSSLDLDVQDNCRFFLYGRTLSSVISSKRCQSGDSRYYYKAGLLATTATEKLRRVNA